MKTHYEEHPEAKEEMSKLKNQLYEDQPELRQICSDRTKDYFKNHPEAGKEHGERMKTHYEDNPQHKKTILDSKGQNKAFDIFTLDEKFIKTFKYQFEAREYLQKEYNITTFIKISEVLSGTRKSSAGFVFKYK